MHGHGFGEALGRLKQHCAAAPMDMRAAFSQDPQRFGALSARFDDMLLDFSKCAVTGETMELLEALARAAGLEERRAAMFAGEPINLTEGRAVLHVALRGATAGVSDARAAVASDVGRVLDAMARFATAVREGGWRGATGKRFTDIVNIGIGGSDLGPQMATLALAPSGHWSWSRWS